jgi:lycopene beta-cyclase
MKNGYQNWYSFFFKMKQLKYQHIIIGGGCAGFQLAKAMLKLPNSIVKSVLIIESSKEHAPKSWCFWADNSHPYRHLVKKEWSSLSFGAYENKKSLPLQKQTYQYIDSQGFINYHLMEFENNPRITIIHDTVFDLENQNEGYLVNCYNKSFIADYVYTSVPNLTKGVNYKPKVWQHFLGWEITTSENNFNPEEATLMDFDVDNNIDGRFIYILPFTENRALVECTIFSNQAFPLTSFENSLKTYIHKKYGSDYKLLKTEKGSVPMMRIENSMNFERLIPIGTAAGCIKASTGYSFVRNLEHTNKIIGYLQGNNRLPGVAYSRFDFYYKLLLWIIENEKHEIKIIFNLLFKNNSIRNILLFLDEKTSVFQEMRIFYSLPKFTFINALFSSFSKHVSSINFLKSISLGLKQTFIAYLNKGKVGEIQKTIAE